MSTTDAVRAHNRGVPLGPQSKAAFEKSKVVTPGGSMRAAVFFAPPPLAGAGVSANMSPLGSEMPRCRAMRSTNDRATTSSIVLDALFNSMP